MYLIVNTVTRSVLCYRDGTSMRYKTEVWARSNADYAETFDKSQPHKVLHISSTELQGLKRATPPWYRR